MLSVRLSDVPAYLQEGGFYKTLDIDESDDTVSVPVNAIKGGTKVTAVSPTQNSDFHP